MSKLIQLFKQYFEDFKIVNKHNDANRIVKPGKLLILLTKSIISFFLILFLVAVLFGFINDRVLYWVEYIKIIFAVLFMYILLYVGLLASHILVTNDYVEYVQYFIKRRKIKLEDIKECQTIYLNGIAKTLRIISRDGISFIDINYSFFNSLKDLKEFTGLIGFPDVIKEKEKHLLTEDEKKKNKQKRKKNAKKVLTVINIIFIFEDIFTILFFVLSYYFNLNRITKIFLILPIIVGWRLLPRFWKKTKKFSLKKMIILTILSIILFCLVFFISASLYNYIKFGHI